MRKIDELVVHTTATPYGKNFTVKQIDQIHRAQGWRCIGYHFLIELDGTISKGRPEAEVGAHVSGHNANSIGVSYVGGLDKKGNPQDTRTPQQKAALIEILTELKGRYPNAKILGHRDFPGVAKACPCFDAIPEYADIGKRPVKVARAVGVKAVAGDTLSAIARDCKLPFPEIRELNPGVDMLEIGQWVRVG